MSSNNYNYAPSNFNRLFTNQEFVKDLVDSIRIKLGRQLIKTEKLFIIQFLRDLNPRIFENKPPLLIRNTIAQHVVEQIVSQKCAPEEPINVHEILKGEIGLATEDVASQYDTNNSSLTQQITNNFTSSSSSQVDVVSLLGSKTLQDLQKIISPDRAKKYAYIVLDTRYRVLESSGIGFFRWNFINNEIINQGTVNAVGNIKDITAIRIFPIRLPYISSADTQYKRISMLIDEFAAQSFIAQENRRFHFMFNTKVDDRWIELKPDDFNDGYFKFRNPISRLDSFTVSFAAPLRTINFDQDRSGAQITSYGTTTEFQTTSDHNLETGDTVFISNFSTSNNNTDSLIVSGINNDAGNIVTSVNSTTFTIDVNSSTIVSANGGGTVSLTNGSAIVTGSSTTFNTLFSANDQIEIDFLLPSPASIRYRIQTVNSPTQITLSSAFTGTTASGLFYRRNNTLNNKRPTVYYGSKRVFIPMELEYLE